MNQEHVSLKGLIRIPGIKSARQAKADKFSFSRQGLKIRFLSYPIDC